LEVCETQKEKEEIMNWIKILNFIDGVFPQEELKLKLGTLYKIRGEDLPFRHIEYSRTDNGNKLYRFKHHQLKEYAFSSLDKVERKANPEEVRLYNLIKNHINSVAENNN
jgi:hypothetical protein